jgi:hypothetical protein
VAHHLEAWRKDYEFMRGTMFYGAVPPFDEVLEVVGALEREFNQPA